MPSLTTLLMPLLPLLPLTSALGINCRGSAICVFEKEGDIAQRLTNYINNIDENRWYNNGEQIACAAKNVCAFLQNTDGAPGRNIKGLAHFIPEHGCKICGSVPYFFPGDNNVDNGELTYNVVGSNACDEGLC